MFSFGVKDILQAANDLRQSTPRAPLPKKKRSIFRMHDPGFEPPPTYLAQRTAVAPEEQAEVTESAARNAKPLAYEGAAARKVGCARYRGNPISQVPRKEPWNERLALYTPPESRLL